ncbi:MAG TPA: hypothetical protein VFK38_07025, partial [Candidatus Limnocylindrales bacterium]|nr:hypothetical protein [Candidatus Limnocylindrales bacterium]
MTGPQPLDHAPGRPARFRYSRWDGTQRLPDLAADEILDAIADDVMAEGDVTEALRRLFQRGLQRPHDGSGHDGLAGLRELLERLAQKRRELLDRYRLDDVLGDVREELEAVIDTERRTVERRLAEAAAGEGDEGLRRMLGELAAKRQAELDALPDDPGGRIRELQDYEFMEASARQRFEDLLDRLRGQVLDSYFEGLADQIRGMTPERLAANREMVRDLNRLLQEKLEGRDPDASDFLARHGAFFPGARTLDDVIEQLAERMAAMQSLLASMSPEQRAELQSLMDALLRDDRLRWGLAQLAATLDQLVPGGLAERLSFRGDEPLSLDGALHQMQRLQRMDRLADQLAGADDPAALADVDPEELRDLVDETSAQDLQALQDLARRLEEAGFAEERGGRLELTPRGSRHLGQRVLDELFARLRRDAFGGHAIRRGGPGGEASESSVAYEFGRPFQVDLRATLGNALARAENAPGRRAGRGLSLEPGDFAVQETEELTRASTVLLVDMSRSMLL